MKITGGNYRDETRIVHMLQALERLELESAGVATVDELSSNDQLSRAIIHRSWGDCEQREVDFGNRREAVGGQ